MARKEKQFSGPVVRGEGIAARDFDFPTANLDLGHQPDLEHGIFAAKVYFDGWEFPGALCYGSGDPPKFEVHLLGFEGDLIGKELDVIIMQKVSELIGYDSKERLRQKIQHDVQLVEEFFRNLNQTPPEEK
ncbi:MAG: riboflavin kinase [Patescibacteria group bacterium]|nr:riboflavin kinase [Patescibacteria group bacterium]